MLEGLLGSFIDKDKQVQATIEKIENKLLNLAEELKCSHKDFFVMIKPHNEEFEFKCWVYKNNEKGVPSIVREITIKEIVTKEDEDTE